MADDDARPRTRDWLCVLALALVLVGGLVYFGRGMAEEQAATAAAAASSPTAQPSATSPQTTASPTVPAPTEPTTEPTVEPPAATCWDGRTATALSLCGLPEGVRGLEWVYPSLATERESCHEARETSPDYEVSMSYVCFERALGQPVTVTYDRVADVDEVAAWMERQVGADSVVALPGAHGGRLLMLDTDQSPARISGGYATFPYLVSVFAPSKQSAMRAWRTLVDQRPPQAIRGVPA